MKDYYDRSGRHAGIGEGTDMPLAPFSMRGQRTLKEESAMLRDEAERLVEFFNREVPVGAQVVNVWLGREHLRHYVKAPAYLASGVPVVRVEYADGGKTYTTTIALTHVLPVRPNPSLSTNSSWTDHEARCWSIGTMMNKFLMNAGMEPIEDAVLLGETILAAGKNFTRKP